jgi:tetratricopeptide (TPR) repeat protein
MLEAHPSPAERLASSPSAVLEERASSASTSDRRVFSAAAPQLAPISELPVVFRECAARVRSKYRDLYQLPVLEYADGSRAYHEGRLYRRHGLNVLFLRGDYVEMALQHGRLLADVIPHGAVSQAPKMIASSVTNALGRQGALGAWFTRRLQRFLTGRMLSYSIAKAQSVLGETTALDEALALSDSTGVPVENLVQGLFNPEILMILAQLSNGSHPLDLAAFREANACLTCCSSFAAWGNYTHDRQLLVGRNMDFPLNGTYDRFPTVTYFEPMDSPIRYMSFGSAGLHNAGITSYNEGGLFLSSHTVPTHDVSSHGVSAFVTANQVIRRVSKVSEAVNLFRQFPPPSGWSYLAVNTRSGEVGTIEMSHGATTLRPADGQSHIQTNHFLSPEMLSRNTFLNASVVDDIEGRYLRLRQRLEQARGRLDPSEVVSILSDQVDPLVDQVRGLGSTLGVHTTLTSVVLDPSRERVFVATGSGPVPHNDYVELPLIGTFDRRDFAAQSRRVLKSDAFRRAHPEKLEAMKIFIKAKIAYESDCDVARAYELLKEVVKTDPSNPAYYFQLGIFALKNQKYDEALAALGEVFEREYIPAQLRRLAHYYRGRTYAHLGKSQAAKTELAAVLDDPATDRKLRAAAERAAWRTRVFGQCALRRRSLSIMMQHSDMLSY